MLAKTECKFCPRYAEEFGVEVGAVIHNLSEVGRRVPYIWVATTSEKKVDVLRESMGIMEEFGNGVVDWGRVMRMSDNVARLIGPENNYVDGAEIAEEKAGEYWEKFLKSDEVRECHVPVGCWDQHVVLANDVNVWLGIAGNGPELEMRKPNGQGVENIDGLVSHIISRYKQLEQTHGVMKSGGMIVHRIEAAMAVQKVTSKDGWNDPRVVSGVSQAYLHFPIEPMLDERFVRDYVEMAIEQSGGIEMVLGAAGGIMNEYLVEMLMSRGHELKLDMPRDDRYGEKYGDDGDRKLLVAHARGFVPKLMEVLWDVMESDCQEKKGIHSIRLEPKA